MEELFMLMVKRTLQGRTATKSTDRLQMAEGVALQVSTTHRRLMSVPADMTAAGGDSSAPPIFLGEPE
jgi:hypothetical protein